MWTEPLVNRRDRRPDLVEQSSGAVVCGPSVDVVPVEGVVTEDGDDVSDVVAILTPFAESFPTQLGYDDILNRRDEDFTPHDFVEDSTPPLKPGLIVGIVAEVKNFDFERNRWNKKDVSLRPGDALEGGLGIQFKLRPEGKGEKINFSGQNRNKIRIVGGSHDSVVVRRKRTRQKEIDFKRFHRGDHFGRRIVSSSHRSETFLKIPCSWRRESRSSLLRRMCSTSISDDPGNCALIPARIRPHASAKSWGPHPIFFEAGVFRARITFSR